MHFGRSELPDGIYEDLISEAATWLEEARTADLDPAEAAHHFGRYIRDAVEQAVRGLPATTRVEAGTRLVNEVIEHLGANAIREPARLLTEMGTGALVRPSAGLTISTLLSNSPGEPSIASEVGREISSSDGVDAIVAFVRWSGIRLIEKQIRNHVEADRPFRLITTTYTGSTERQSLDRLVDMGAEVKVSYETNSTRLHAKAWVFHRHTGHSSALIGSSNLSRSAFVDGLEWNVRAATAENPEVVAKAAAVFDSYWEDPAFETYDPDKDAERFDAAIASIVRDDGIDLSFLHVRPYPHQQEILDALHAERHRHGRWSNLVVAATGTGKTVVAALDYKRLRNELDRSRLLFVAHRKEILEQSRRTFRAVLGDGAFGELLVDNHVPEDWDNVFGSIQSLNGRIDDISPSHYDVVIIDEFHHAAANTYSKLINHLEPKVMLGLTATPERADGRSISHWFSDRFAAELRLWDAIDQNLLVPFHYFGIHDEVDLSGLTWSGGSYRVSDLENVYTGNSVRTHLILKAISDKIVDPASMRALGFCVSKNHAHDMAAAFNQAGIPSAAVTADTPRAERAAARKSLESGELAAIFAVDIFNEGVDIPAVDTALFLRPTESITVFLQQLGRGLRQAHDKAVLTVLDFVGNQNRKFRFDLRFQAMTGNAARDITRDIEHGFPFLPSGCHIDLDREVSRIVIESIKNALPSKWPARVAALKDIGSCTLAEYLSHTNLDIIDVYRSNHSWTEMRRQAGFETGPQSPDEERLRRAVGRLLHIQDESRLGFYSGILEQEEPPNTSAMNETDRRMTFMLHLDLWGLKEEMDNLDEGLRRLWAVPTVKDELRQVFAYLEDTARTEHPPFSEFADTGLNLHARYTRDEVMAALGQGSTAKPATLREGVKWMKEIKADAFFVTLEKSDKDYSATTRYNDYAISPSLFHWESQSTTASHSPTGQRYIQHQKTGSHVLLFVRERKKGLMGETLPYVFLGAADYVSHEGDRPMAIRWKLHTPMPASLFTRLKVVA